MRSQDSMPENPAERFGVGFAVETCFRLFLIQLQVVVDHRAGPFPSSLLVSSASARICRPRRLHRLHDKVADSMSAGPDQRTFSSAARRRQKARGRRQEAEGRRPQEHDGG